MPQRMVVQARKEAIQGRSKATVEAILRAAAHILVRTGYEATTTNRVAVEAGVSIGSLYQYFPNKEAIVSALIDRHLSDQMQWLRQAALHAMAHDVSVEILAECEAKDAVEVEGREPRDARDRLERQPLVEVGANVHARTCQTALY